MRRFFGYGLAGILVILLLFGAGGWAGYRLANDLENGRSLAARIHVRLESYYNSYFRTNTPLERSIPAIHLTLMEKIISLPVEAEYYAGGISGFQGRSVLVVDRLGHFFHVENDRTQRMAIAAPDNRATALRQQLVKGRFGQATVDFKWFRYNDLLHMQDGEQQWLLLSYTEWQPEDFCFNSALARLDLPAGSAPQEWKAAPGDWKVVARTSPCLPPLSFGEAIRGLEAGGRLVAKDTTTVLWTSGAYERDDAYPDAVSLAQDNIGDYGKILEVDLARATMRHVAKGLRNPQGLALAEDGTIWVTDHGMRAGDELNRVDEGANFGYPIVTYGTRYDRKPAGALGRHAWHDGFDKPMLAFVPGIAPGSAIALKNFHYAWDGDILVGAFRGDLYRVHVEDGRVIFAERIEIGVRPRDMVMLDDGRFAVWTDFRQLIFYSAAQDPDPARPVLDRLAALTPELLREHATQAFETCLTCHALAADEHGTGPSLAGICGRAPGKAAFAGYSPAMIAADEPWTTKQLAAFIDDPQAVIPGTTMGWGPLDNAATAAALAQVLCPRAPSG